MKRLVLSVAAAVALAVGAGVAVARVSRPASMLEVLNRAQPERVHAARFSVGTRYHACTVDKAFADSLVPRETCAEPRDAQSKRLDELAAAGKSLDPDSLRAAALVAMVWDSTALDEAIEDLSTARKLTDDPVPILVDLSAAHLVRAQLTQNPEDVWRALEYALEATELEPGNPLARFNAALAAQAGYLRDTAEQLWGDYLALDSTSQFAAEARRKRDVLRADSMFTEPGPSSSLAEIRAFAARHPQQARELGLETALGAWGQAVLEGKAARAETMLALAQHLGAAISSQGGDASLPDAVAAIVALRGDRAATRTLAQAHRAYAAGCEWFDVGQWSVASDSFAVVLRLRPASPPLTDWARAEQAAMLSLGENTNEAQNALRPLVRHTDSVRYPALAARVQWINARLVSTDSGDVLRRQAAQTYRRLREWEGYGALHYRGAWAEHGGGNTPVAYRITNEALRALRPHDGSTHLHGALVQSADMIRRDGLHRAAQLIQAEDYTRAMRSINPTLPVEALQSRARIRASTDSNALARQDLEAAEPLLGMLPEGSQTDYLRAVQQYSRTLVSPDGAGAIARLDSAMRFFLDNHREEWYFKSRTLRADLLLEAGELRDADRDLDSLTARFRALPRNPRGFHDRAIVLERLRSSHDRLVMRYVRAGRTRDALLVLERSRVSFASDTSRRATPAPWATLRPDQVVLEYALIGNTLLTFVVRRDSITLREQRVNRDSLLRAMARVDVAMESFAPTSAMAADLRRLYDVLIRPVLGRIPAGNPELVIVADGEIAGVPFGALLAGSAGDDYLIHSYAVSHALSLSELAPVASSARNGGHVLLVANPAFDERANSELDPLPGATTEVDALRRTVYPGARQLDSAAATIAAFRDGVAGARAVHYAGHAVFENSRPEQSFLLLADSGTSGRLTAGAMNGMPLDGVQLVVLSACRTVRGWQGRSGGFAGLSGALLNAGVNGVVGSLWLADDSLTQPLMVNFHREYQISSNPARALQRAQRASIDSGAPPAVWAGFRYMGR